MVAADSTTLVLTEAPSTGNTAGDARPRRRIASSESLLMLVINASIR